MLGDDIARRKDEIVEDFHHLYYDGFETTWEQTFWRGIKILKCPLDLWVYQEILWDQKPDLVLETGTAHGGSALWFADMLETIGHGEIITIDIEGSSVFPDRPKHGRLTYIQESSTNPELVSRLSRLWAGKNVLVVLDSNHSKSHVLQELRMWSPIVPSGGFLIVEDTNVHGHPVCPEHPEGPYEAVEEFLASNSYFVQVPEMEKFQLTFNPGGFLRRR